jgi:hypothetical protein
MGAITISYGWVGAVLVLSFVAFVLIFGYCLIRKPPSSLRMKMTKWWSFEAEWSDEKDTTNTPTHSG